ncbi:beta-ketoacyl-ACP synthase III [Embleya sp. NPDC059237]|uniref:beta-ketoacyl-ACP synthase III n=1 Tax=Embleya sp. NPDC059237 TaxID=3346784 RepID=UPI0036B3B3A3
MTSTSGDSTGADAAVICGIGAELPHTRVPNAHICAHLDVTPDWIHTRTGITHRVRADDHVTTADLATRAGAQALRSSGNRTADALVVATISPDHRCPATAPRVAARLGLPGIPAFDISAACTGFLYALRIAAGFLTHHAAQRMLVIAADRIPHMTDPTDPITAPLFADGAGAVVLRRGHAGEPGALGPILLGADATHADAIVIPHHAPLRMRGRETFKHAVEHMSHVSERALQAAGWTPHDVDRFIPHQANARITTAVGRRLGIDEPRVLHDIERVGNTGAASIPLTLARAHTDGRLRPGHRVLLTAFGAGLTWGATTLVWPDPNTPSPHPNTPHRETSS